MQLECADCIAGVAWIAAAAWMCGLHCWRSLDCWCSLEWRDKPALLWTLRDFALELAGPGGEPISSNEYLEQTLNTAAASKAEPSHAGPRSLRTALPASLRVSATQDPGVASVEYRRSERLFRG